MGHVFIGRLRFGKGKPKRVAVKIFKHELTDEMAAQYQQAIRKLSEAGVRLPKMAMYKHPEHGWVQVSQLFHSKGASKIVEKSWFWIENQAARREAIDQLARVANAGYFPALDLVEPFTDNKKGIIPFDLDYVVSGHKKYEKGDGGNTEILVKAINELGKTSEEKRDLLQIALTIAPRLTTHIQKHALKHKWYNAG